MTPPPQDYSEDSLVEQPAMDLLAALGWNTANLYNEWSGGQSSEGRRTKHDVVLAERLRKALIRLNPKLPPAALDQAMEEVARDRSNLVPVNANQELYKLLKHGVPVEIPDPQGGMATEVAQLIDWRNVEANDFFLASQYWVLGETYERRCDLVGFVNGIPLLLFELKATHKTLKSAFDDNLRDYRATIPALFVPNAFVVLSNGSKTVLGSTYAGWEHFFDWKRINDEGEVGVVSLDTVIRGTCAKERFLDIVENFILYEEAKGGLIKKIAKNHQYLGVNKAIAELQKVRDRPQGTAGRLGVFWHTQGSGKSLSMVFFTQKVFRTIRGNWTFLIVTDRRELDEQIYKTYANTGAVTESEAHATSSDHLKQLLTQDHRYVFTLIQKFGAEKGKPYPKLSDRQDIIVITDEAHRSQYDILALNMRAALPNAAFIGFTGTPLMAGEEKTKEVFGDYISVYNFAQSIADGATVPLYYENRIPELQLTNDNLKEELEQILEEAELDETQERKLEREFAREYHLITRDDRLETIAEDLVQHFMGRGYRGKAMMVCIDKATTVRMYDKVRKHWALYLDDLKIRLGKTQGEAKQELQAKIGEMEAMDMAVIVSQGQNEAADLAAKGLDIVPHRKRMIEEDLEEAFKDSDDPLRLVFVCAMWITGFDVPSCSTIYLDKPMKNHTLMQTIARANRTYPGKAAGLIVDYVGVFRNLQKALAVYGGISDQGDMPVESKAALVERLRQLIVELKTFCLGHGIEADKIKTAKGFDKIALLDSAVDALVRTDDIKKAFMATTSTMTRIYQAVLPDPIVSDLAPDAGLFAVIAQKIRVEIEIPGSAEKLAHVMGQVEALLDRSVAPVPYTMPDPNNEPLINLAKIDFDKLKEHFAKGHKNTEAQKLRALLAQKVQIMVARNRSRIDLLERFEKLIDAYNSTSINIETFFAELMKFGQSLDEEDQRAMREGMSEEELALFDILTKPEPELTDKERNQVKKVCRELLAKLKKEKLVLDWTNKAMARGEVRRTIEIMLDEGLPEAYGEDLYDTKCNAAFLHILESYQGPRGGIYGQMH